MRQTAEASIAEGELAASQLARFFPEVGPVGTCESMALSRVGASKASDMVFVEFAGREKAIFSSSLPLEFGDTVRLATEAGKVVEAQVIAVQYWDGRTAVAAQVLKGQFSWVNRP
jgi:hypothetical protein